MSFIVGPERRHWRTRVLYAGMYVVVIIGALSMLYPFLIMLSGSVKSVTDFDDFEVIPSYFRDDVILYRKFENARYNGNQRNWQIAMRSGLQSWEDIPYPRDASNGAAADILEFVASKDCPPTFVTLGQIYERGAQPKNLRKWRAFLSKRFDSSLDALNRAMGTNFSSWDLISVPDSPNRIAGSPLEKLFREEFRPTLAAREFCPYYVEGVFVDFLRQKYGPDIAKLNKAAGTTFTSYDDISLSRDDPSGQPVTLLWEQFVCDKDLGIYPTYVKLLPSARDAYLTFLRTRYATIDAYNRAYGTTLASFDAVSVPSNAPASDTSYSDFKRFLKTRECLPYVEIDSFEFRWRDWLKAKYSTIAACSAAHGRTYTSFETIPLKLDEYDAWLMLRNRASVVWEFLVRNYLYVFDFLFLHGSALKVTFLFVALNVLLHLIVNPLAAYALSRHRLRFGHWILLFCVLTMAFPAEVGSIPRFLLIRELGLLNTIWALVLPGAAHGFSIFILKNFFDSLPQELYEAATIESASEFWMFRNVTLALTKPILAVTAFGAFTSAYGAFLFALIIAPDEKMWTISVWLYQFQQNAGDSVRFASLAVASIPILLAFVVMQRFILQGIVLPVER